MRKIKQLYCNSSAIMRNNIFLFHDYDQRKDNYEYDVNGEEHRSALQFQRMLHGTECENAPIYFRYNGRLLRWWTLLSTISTSS